MLGHSEEALQLLMKVLAARVRQSAHSGKPGAYLFVVPIVPIPLHYGLDEFDELTGVISSLILLFSEDHIAALKTAIDYAGKVQGNCIVFVVPFTTILVFTDELDTGADDEPIPRNHSSMFSIN